MGVPGPEVPEGVSSPAPPPKQPKRWWTKPWAIGGILLAVVSAGIVGLVLLIIATTGIERDPNGGVSEPDSISVFDVEPGDCLENVEFYGEATSLKAVPCSDLHRGEALSRFSLPSGEYPGDEAVVAVAERRCSQAVDELVRPSARSGTEHFYLYPTERSWKQQNDREIVCIALSVVRRGGVAR